MAQTTDDMTEQELQQGIELLEQIKEAEAAIDKLNELKDSLRGTKIRGLRILYTNDDGRNKEADIELKHNRGNLQLLRKVFNTLENNLISGKTELETEFQSI